MFLWVTFLLKLILILMKINPYNLNKIKKVIYVKKL